ncbi:hypothetical protein VNO78_34003 [Psophocarpus tetragonolobus]|uniref:Senescence-associated carboxylesterase 101 n=1 Tax=Psophocarpus tetragonolobus TaxID=3891 RepID=A0AAN9RLR6_PSOTE
MSKRDRVEAILVIGVQRMPLNLNLWDHKLLVRITCPTFGSTMTSSLGRRFSSGIELASFVTSNRVLHRSWNVISSYHEDIGSKRVEGEELSWKVYQRSDLMIIAFETTLASSNLQPDLVPSYALKDEIFLHFDLLCDEICPIFSVNSTTISLFRKNYHKLNQLKSEINSSTPLIVTGLGLGGSVASLFTISLLESIQFGKNRPLCITYGSPLIGDKKFQQTISSSPIWNSCFLNVVSLEDSLPRLFITNRTSPTAAFTPHTSAYMPFGTFLFFYSNVNCICFENPHSVLELLVTMCPIHNQEFQCAHYGNIVENLNDKTIFKDFIIGLQLRALALKPHMPRMVLSNPLKKLNQMEEGQGPEWYKSTLHPKLLAQATDPPTLQSTMIQSTLFWSGIELAPFVTSSGLLRRSWDVVTCCEGIISYKGEKGLWLNVYKEPDSNLMIIAIEATLNSSNLQADLVPSSTLQEEKFLHFEFLCTKINPIFSINSTAINTSTRLIVTGLGLGGSVASLFTISLLESIQLGKNPPLCITYGSPLIGDKNFQQAISRSPIWNSCFLHVVITGDPLPKLFIPKPSLASERPPQTSAYMPFGTFFFCSDINSTCLENPITVLEFLMEMGSIQVQNQGFEYADYSNIVENLNHKAICKDRTSTLTSSVVQEGLTPNMLRQRIHYTLEKRMNVLDRRFIYQKKFMFSPSKKLNVMKMDMAQLEWYKKHTKNLGIGYYDSYKNMKSTWDIEVEPLVKKLIIYWEKMVEDAKIKPQKRGAALRKSWLYAGNSFRKMVEPLAIAQHYREGGKDYVTKNRPEHFVLLEEWFRNEMTEAKTSNVEAIWDCNSDSNWSMCRSVVDKAICSSQDSMVFENWGDNLKLNLISDDENDRTISSTMCLSSWSRVDQLLLSSKELNFEENLNTTSKCNEEDSCFEARVNECLVSHQGSDKEESIKEFELHVAEAVLSSQGSIPVKELEENLNRMKKKNVELLLTFDSCFWAHVEEARISCKELQAIKGKKEPLKNLVKFEKYVYRLLKNYQVSPDIFLPRSSYMRWWKEYKAIKETSYDSKLANFMKDVRKHNQYALGEYDFP